MTDPVALAREALQLIGARNDNATAEVRESNVNAAWHLLAALIESLSKPVEDEAGLTAPQIVLWINDRIRILKQWLGDNPDAKMLAVARSEVRAEIAKLGLFAKAVSGPALRLRAQTVGVTDEMVDRAISAMDVETWRVVACRSYGNAVRDGMRAALTAALSPNTKPTTENEALGNGRAMR